MELRLTIEGTGAILSQLTGARRALLASAASALRIEHELIMTRAKLLTPVDTGALRSSGHVEATRETAGALVSSGGFGGPAADYAVYVHENLRARHRVGQAKFYEIPLVAAQTGMADRLAASMRREMEARRAT